MLENKVKDIFSNEVAKNWDKKSKYISKINGEHFKFKSLIFKYCKDSMRILEVGCGTGQNLIYIDENYKNCDITGIDLSSDMLEQIKYNFVNSNINLLNIDIFDLYEDKKYDLIIVKQILHHISNKNEFINKLYKLLENDGKILLMFPNEEFIYNIYEFEKNGNDILGRISDEEIYKMLYKTKFKIETILRKKFVYEFKNIKNFLDYLYSIGTLQKINNYKFNDNTYNLYKNIFNSILIKEENLKVNIGYTYIILEKVE